MKSVIYLTFPILFAPILVAGPALAQSSVEVPTNNSSDEIILTPLVRDPFITVIASGSAQKVTETGQSISVIGADEIASIQGPDLTRVLERAPGVTITRNGGLGGFTGVRVRGADAEQLLVLVDGVRVNDVSSPGAGFDFGTLLSGGISKIELLRGSNSVVWGSQAIGGVLAVTTRDARGVAASAEYGSRNTFDGQASGGFGDTRANLTLNGGYTRTAGISAAAAGTEPDGFRQWRVGGRGRVALGDNFALVAAARYADSKTDIDGYPAPNYTFADTPEYQKTREASGRIGAAAVIGMVEFNAGYALSDIRRVYYDPTFGTAPSYAYTGRSERADLTGHAALPAAFTLDFGADNEWTRFSSTFDAQKKARLASGHALLGWSGGALNLAAGVRYDDHSRFGGAWTTGANASANLGDQWRIRASYGEGFKAPTLYQLFSDYGNQALVPERSRSFDAGVERGNRNGGLHFALTAFRRDSRNLIDFVSCFGKIGGICTARPYGTYDNVSRTRAQGIEAEGDVMPTDRLAFHAAYSFVKATNRATGKDLARRPRHALTLASDWRTPLANLTLGADLRLVGDSFDNAANTARLDGYALVTVRASVPLGERFELYGRVENVADVKYQTVAGYGTQGRAGYIGVRARL